MKWKNSPVIKIYEALGAIGDGRIELLGENGAKVWSSSGSKYYNVTYDENKKAIMANDNGSYWKGYLGYPSIAYLMLKGKLSCERNYAEALKEIEWKDLNTFFKNDFEKTQKHVDDLLRQRGITLSEFEIYLSKVEAEINDLNLELLGNKIIPPEGN